MTSFNHYALGRGRRLAAPHASRVWRRRRRATGASRCARCPAAGLTAASARHLTPYGEADGRPGSVRTGELVVRATRPGRRHGGGPLPGDERVQVGHGSHEWRCPTRRTARDAAPNGPRCSWTTRTSGPRSRPGGAPTLTSAAMVRVGRRQPSLADRLRPTSTRRSPSIPDVLTLRAAR